MSKRMKKNLSFLVEYKNARTLARRKRLLERITPAQVATLGEISKNIAGNRIRMTGKQKRGLCKYKRFVRYMGSRKRGFKHKKKVLRGGFAATAVGLLISTIAPIIAGLINKKKSK